MIIRLKGQAEAYAIDVRAKAEAEQLEKKADAFREYKDAAILEMMLDTLPKVAAEVAAPISQVNRVVMVSGSKGDVGAAKLTGECAALPTTSSTDNDNNKHEGKLEFYPILIAEHDSLIAKIHPQVR